MLSRKLRFLKFNEPSGSRGGFTLIELMIVVAVIAIMTGVAIPAIISWLPNYRLKAASRELYSNMHRAKLEAIKQNNTVKMTITIVGVGPPPSTCPAAGGGGYIFFIDDGSGAAGIAGDNVQNGAEPIISNIILQQGVCVVSSTFAAGSGFGPKGMPAGGTGTIVMGHPDFGRQIPVRQTVAGGLRVD